MSRLRALAACLVRFGLATLLLITCMPISLVHTIASPAETPTRDYPPLPGGCGGVLPPQDACCMSGYIFVDGQPISNAKITVEFAGQTIEAWTGPHADHPLPYYQIDLSGGEVKVRPGETITVTAEYSGHRRTLTHTALVGWQHIDVVLPRSGMEDYVATGRIWKQGEERRLAFPTGIAVDSQGNVYIADSGNNRIQVYNRLGEYLLQWGTLGNQAGALAGPFGIAADGHGGIYVVDAYNSRVQKFSSTGEFQLAWGRRGTADGEFTLPAAIAIDNEGDILVSDAFNHRIQKFSADGRHLKTFGEKGSGPGQFLRPVGVAVDEQGFIYVADRDNHRIQKLSSDGTAVQIWGNVQGNGPCQFSYPEGLTLDRAGNIYVSDWDNQRVQKLMTDGRCVVWGSYGTDPGQFRGPRGIAADLSPGADHIYVVDNENHRVQRFSQDGEWRKTIGDGNSAGNHSQFASPVGVAVTNDRIYLTEWGDHSVKVFDPQSRLLASIGNGRGTSSRAVPPTDGCGGRCRRHDLRRRHRRPQQLSLWACPDLQQRGGLPKGVECLEGHLRADRDRCGGRLRLRRRRFYK